MKRSEMIRKIKSIIATCGPTQPTIVTAEQVLRAIEEAGMLPPEQPIPEYAHSAPNEWEPEDVDSMK
jgi:hypothetical protein